MSALLQNHRNWKPTQTLLKHARRIIEVCGGDTKDLDDWTEYHHRVVTYLITRDLPLPTPPEPTQFAASRHAATVALATADPTGDRPRRPRRRWALHIATWAIVFGCLAWLLVYELDLHLWQYLITAAFALLLPMTGITIATLLLAYAGPRLDAASRRHQERSLRANLPDSWPIFAFYVLVLGVIWSISPLFDMSWLSIELKILFTGAVVITLLRVGQLQVRKRANLDTAWPPTITPDTLTFRRAANRLRQLLTTDQPGAHDHAQQRQAESILSALAEIRAELTRRSHLTWRQWLIEGPSNDLLPAINAGILTSVVTLDCAGLAIRPWHDATVRSVSYSLAILAMAIILAAMALTVSFRAQRRHDRRLVEELRERETALRPLVFPSETGDATTLADS